MVEIKQIIEVHIPKLPVLGEYLNGVLLNAHAQDEGLTEEQGIDLIEEHIERWLRLKISQAKGQCTHDVVFAKIRNRQGKTGDDCGFAQEHADQFGFINIDNDAELFVCDAETLEDVFFSLGFKAPATSLSASVTHEMFRRVRDANCRMQSEIREHRANMKALELVIMDIPGELLEAHADTIKRIFDKE